MKKRVASFIYIFLLISSGIVRGQSVAEQAQQALGINKSEQKLFVGVVETRTKQRAKLQQGRAQLISRNATVIPELKSLAEEAKSHIAQTTRQLEHKKDNEFTRQKLALLNESYLVFKDAQRDSEKMVNVIDDSIRALSDFLDDPDFNTFKKEQKLRERLYYSFEDLQRLDTLILDQEKKVAALAEQEKHLNAELANRKRAVEATKEAYKTKKEQIESGKLADGFIIDAQQRKELIALEERLYNYRRLLDTLRVKEMEYKIDLASLQLSIAKSHLGIYKDYARIVKPVVRVTEADIVHAREELAKSTNTYRVAKEQFRSEIDLILSSKEDVDRRLHDSAKAYNISLGREIDEWSKEPAQTAEDYLNYCEVGVLYAQSMLYQREQELLDAQIELEDEKLKEETLLLQVKESYHKKFTTEEEITRELKNYDGVKVESNSGLARYKEKINAVADQLSMQKRTLDNIASLRKKLEKIRDVAFKSRSVDYNRCVELLRQAEHLEKEQIDILSKLTGAYSGLTAVASNKLRLIGFITTELGSRTIWHRPEYAITWEGVKNIIPDVIAFLTYLRSYFVRTNAATILRQVRDVVTDPLALSLFAAKMLAVLAALFIFRRYFLRTISWLPVVNTPSRGIRRVMGLLLLAITGFLNTYFIGISLWILTFAALTFLDFSDPYIYIVFYLLSIPYLLYLANRFMRFMAAFNQEYDYPFLAADFQSRFFLVSSIFLYCSITIALFRESFMLAHFYRSELPTILLAVNFIIFQISLILLIDKEQILGLIPNTSDFWLWVHGKVNQFYYLILLLVMAIIVMSNPYVGFGRLVLYVFFGAFYSILLLTILYWIHQLFKRGAAKVFFTASDDVTSERFASAKTWFGLLVISSFLFLSFLGIVIGAKIWGWPVTLSKVMDLFYHPIIGVGSENPISTMSFLNILFFVLVGFLIAYILNKFMLERVFDLLNVDQGVQHTISSIMQYIVIMGALFLGFQSARLGGLVNYIIGALILGLGWVLKEPISDFVSYFIILVQRPVKIGDFIVIDEEITGVVRKITARSVVLRKKNSMSVIIPNSFLLNRPVYNWNYTRNFIAIDDIILRVDYAEDPEKVQEILYGVLESHPNVLKNPKPWVRLDDFNEIGYEFMVRGFISSVYTLEKWEIASAIRLRIVKAFDEHGIKFAIPARVIITRSGKYGESISRQ